MFKFITCHGVPQCGFDVIRFDTWNELEEFLESNPSAEEEIQNGYASIIKIEDKK